MKAIVLKTFGESTKAFSLEEIALPEIKEGEILIRSEAFGLNFADVLARKGLYGETPDLPCVLGYEVCGIIEKAGSSVPTEMIGKRVLAFTRFGGYAEYVATDYRLTAILENDLPAAKALALATQYTTAYYMLEVAMNLFKGDKILIHAAAGGVGIALTQLAGLKSCEIYATAGSDKKIAFLKENGVEHCINYNRHNYKDEIEKLLNGDKLAATFNSLAGKTFNMDLGLLGAGGKLALFGASSRVGKVGGLISGLKLLFKTGFLTPLKLIMQSKSVIGINILKIADQNPMIIADCMKKVVALAEERKIDPYIGGQFSVAQINEAHRLLENRESMGKISITWN